MQTRGSPQNFLYLTPECSQPGALEIVSESLERQTPRKRTSGQLCYTTDMLSFLARFNDEYFSPAWSRGAQNPFIITYATGLLTHPRIEKRSAAMHLLS